MNERQKILTEDGSHSFYVPEIDEHYHSSKGALQESKHIFIGEGFLKIEKSEIRILEVGFGTGLNAFLTYVFAKKEHKKVRYFGLEKFPITPSDALQLNYSTLFGEDEAEAFERIHKVMWNKEIEISNFFLFTKEETDFTTYEPKGDFDVIYFDAFSPEKQPEMWSESMFDKLYKHTSENGILVTYSVKGMVKRALKSVGFEITKRPGPPGKREILVAHKKTQK